MSELAIVVLSGDTYEMLEKCLRSIKEWVSVDYTLYLGYNSPNNVDKVKGLCSELFPDNHKVVIHEKYNFAKNNNDIIKNHLNGEKYVLFCNNDVFLRDKCVDNMVFVFENNDLNIGTLGVRLLFEDGTIQHDGQYVVVSKEHGFIGASHYRLREPNDDNRETYTPVIGNTMALCMTKLSDYLEVGGLNEEYEKCFEDVEYNVELAMRDKMNIILPSSYWAWHFESQTRKNNGSLVMESDIGHLRKYINSVINEDSVGCRLCLV